MAKKDDLIQEAKSLGLDESGTIPELEARIAAHKSASTSASEGEEQQTPPVAKPVAAGTIDMDVFSQLVDAETKRKADLEKQLQESSGYALRFQAPVRIMSTDGNIKHSDKLGGNYLMVKVEGVAMMGGKELPVTLNTNLDWLKKVNLEVGQVVKDCWIMKYTDEAYNERIQDFMESAGVDEARARTVISQIKFDVPKGFQSVAEVLQDVSLKQKVSGLFNQTNTKQAASTTKKSAFDVLDEIGVTSG